MAHQEVPLDTLRDLVWCLKYADLKDRKDAIGRLTEIAHSIGIDRTTEELIPFMQVLIIRNEDLECLKSLLDQLIDLAPFLAGSDCVHQLMPSFESLLKTADECVQTRTVDCLKLYSKDVSSNNFELHFKPHLHRLSTDTCVSTRRIACRLYSTYYPRVPFAHKEDLLNDYGHLCRDSAVCVRLSAADNLGELSKVVDFERLRSAVIPLFITLTQDEVDDIRVISVDTFLRICGKLIPRNVEQLLMPIFVKLVDDNSYRVRLQIATTILELQKAVGVGMSKNYLVPAVAKFLNDSTADVRTTTVVRTYEFCSNLELGVRESFVKSFILPQVERLSCDPSQEVRIATCDLLKLANFLTLESVQMYLVSSAISLLRDDCHLVQYRTASNLGHVRKAIDIAVLSNVVNAEMLVAVKQSKTEKLLRIVDCLPLFAAELGEEFMNEKLLEFVISTEAGHSNVLVKVTILNAMRKTVSILKRTWVNLVLLPQLITLLGKRTTDADEQCFIWTQVLLMGFPAGFTDSGTLSLLIQLNDRSIDKSELRSVVFHAVKEAKNDVDDEMLKNAMEVLEDTLFRDSVDKEFLQLALTDTANLILKDPPKTNLATVQLRDKRHRVDSLSIPSNRFSLPATPLFEEGTNFDFTKIITTNGSTNSAYDVTLRRRGQIGSRPTSWSLASRMSVEESKNLLESPVMLDVNTLVGVDEKQLEPILIEDSEENQFKETGFNGENESSVLIKVDMVSDVEESIPEENRKTIEDDLANDQLQNVDENEQTEFQENHQTSEKDLDYQSESLYDHPDVQEINHIVIVTQKLDIVQSELTDGHEDQQINEDGTLDDQPVSSSIQTISDKPGVDEDGLLIGETQNLDIDQSGIIDVQENCHIDHQTNDKDLTNDELVNDAIITISVQSDVEESIPEETQKSDIVHSEISDIQKKNSDQQTKNNDLTDDRLVNDHPDVEEGNQIIVEPQKSDIGQNELTNGHESHQTNEDDTADDQPVHSSIQTISDHSGVDEESLLIGEAQKVDIDQSSIIDVQESCHSDHQADDKDLEDDRLVIDINQTISDHSDVEENNHIIIETQKSDTVHSEINDVQKLYKDHQTDSNNLTDDRLVNDQPDLKDGNEIFAETQKLDLGYNEIIDVQENHHEDHQTNDKDLTDDRLVNDQPGLEEGNQILVETQKSDIGHSDIIDGQENNHNDHQTNDKDLMDDRLSIDTIKAISDQSDVEGRCQPETVNSDISRHDLTTVQENGYKDCHTNENVSSEDKLITDVVESTSYHSSVITESESMVSEQPDDLMIDIRENQPNNVYETSMEDLASNQPDSDTVQSNFEKSDMEESSQQGIDTQKLDIGDNKDHYTNEKVANDNELISNVVENCIAKEDIEVVVESQHLVTEQDEVQLIQDNLQNHVYEAKMEDIVDDNTHLNVIESSSSHSVVEVHRVVVESQTSYSNVYNVQQNSVEIENHGNEDLIDIEDSTNHSKSHELYQNVSSHSVVSEVNQLVVESHTSTNSKVEMQLIDFQADVQEHHQKEVEDQEINDVIHGFIDMDEHKQVYEKDQTSENDQDEAFSMDIDENVNDELYIRHVRFDLQPQMMSISVDEYANSGVEDFFDDHNFTGHGADALETEITVSDDAEDEKFQDAEDTVVTNGKTAHGHENTVIVSRGELKSTQTFFDLMDDDDTIEV